MPVTSVAGTLAAAYSGTSVTPTLPAHVSGDILIAASLYNASSTLSCATSGWATIVASEANANLSTGWFWKRAASGAETNPQIDSSATATSTAGLYANTFVVSGALASGTPFEDATLNGTPTTDTTPASGTITTTVDNALAIAFAAIDSSIGFVSGLPPAGYTTLVNTSDANGTGPTLTAGAAMVANTDSAAPFTLSIAMPTGHAADDILIVHAMQNGGADFTTATSGWAAITGAASNNASFSTSWFWKRATSGAEANMVLESSLSGGTIGIAAFPFFVRGCRTTGDPWEGLAFAGSPTSDTTPDSSAITTLGADRLVLACASIGDNNTISNYPPALWSAGANFNSATGTDYTAVIIQRTEASPTSISAVDICTQSASDFWRTMTLAFVPTTGGRITVITDTRETAGDATGVTIGTLTASTYWKTLALSMLPAITAASYPFWRMKRRTATGLNPR